MLNWLLTDVVPGGLKKWTTPGEPIGTFLQASLLTVLGRPHALSRRLLTILTAMVLFHGAMAGPLLAQAEQTPPPAATKQSGRAITSLIEYVPQPAQFPSDLAPVTELIRDAAAAGAGSGREKELLTAAVERADELVANLPRGLHDETLFLKGYSLERLGRSDEAIVAYDRSLNLQGANPLAVVRKSLVQKKLGRYREALAGFHEVLWRTHIFPHEMLYLIGECELAMGNAPAAQSHFAEALTKNPQYVPALHQVTEELQRQYTTVTSPTERQRVEALLLQRLDQLYSLDPSDQKTALELGWMLLGGRSNSLSDKKKANLDRAESIAKKAATDTNYGNLDAVQLLVGVQRRKGELDEADSTLKLALRRNPRAPELSGIASQIAIDRQLAAQAALPSTAPQAASPKSAEKL